MDYKSIENFEEGIIIKDVVNFKPKDIFECGQCFRWDKQPNGNYIGVAYGRVIEVEKRENDIIIYNTNLEDFNTIWHNYFDLGRDYSKIKANLSKDPLLKKAVEFGEGIRLLQQEPFEILISFIISANNRIPMIKRAINKICEKWGEPIEYKEKEYYSFPTIESFHSATLEELQLCSLGFRAKYIKDTIDKVYNNKQNNVTPCFDTGLDWIKGLDSDKCQKELKKFNGVGPKVADCIMLFSMEKYSSFPVDVWVKRAMQHFYIAPDVSLPKIREFAINKFGSLSGFAQQYLFYYARENNIKI